MRLIDLDEVRKAFRVAAECANCPRDEKMHRYNCRDYEYTAYDACTILDELEVIDAVPVMRCEDCKWWHKDDEPDPNGRCECDCNGGWWLPEDYCSCGERR